MYSRRSRSRRGPRLRTPTCHRLDRCRLQGRFLSPACRQGDGPDVGQMPHPAYRPRLVGGERVFRTSLRVIAEALISSAASGSSQKITSLTPKFPAARSASSLLTSAIRCSVNANGFDDRPPFVTTTDVITAMDSTSLTTVPPMPISMSSGCALMITTLMAHGRVIPLTIRKLLAVRRDRNCGRADLIRRG